MILVRMGDNTMSAIFSAMIAGIMCCAEPDPRKMAVTAFRTGLTTEKAKPVDGAMLVSVKTELGQIIEMSRVCCRVQGAEERVFLLPQP